MAQYPGAESERKFSESVLRTLISKVFQGCGMAENDADLLADSLVQADFRGIHSHGVMRVPDYVGRLTRGGVNPKGRPRVVKDHGAALVIDGDNTMGQIGASFAMQKAIERARTISVAAAVVGGSNHCGAMEYYARMALAEDMIGIAATNALPTMAPWGGIDKIVGLNPLAIGIPGGHEGPIVLDIALGATAHGKMQVYAQKGQPIPEGWAFDAEGRPTTDVKQALAGLIQPIGAYKGIGLAMAMGILSTVLSGAGYGTESGNMADGPIAGADGHFFMALNVAAFEDLAKFKTRLDTIIRQYNASRLAPNADRVYVPGALEARLADQHRREGIPLNEATIAGIIAAAAELGVDASVLR